MDIMTTLFDEEEVSRRYYLRVEREATERGMQQGMQQGRKESAEKIARNLLEDGISYEKISAYTGLSVSEIENFARNTK